MKNRHTSQLCLTGLFRKELSVSQLQGSLFQTVLETRTEAEKLLSILVLWCYLLPESGLFTYVQLHLLTSPPCSVPWCLMKNSSKLYSILQVFYRRQVENVWEKLIEMKKHLVSLFGCLVLTAPPAFAGLISLSSWRHEGKCQRKIFCPDSASNFEVITVLNVQPEVFYIIGGLG